MLDLKATNRLLLGMISMLHATQKSCNAYVACNASSATVHNLPPYLSSNKFLQTLLKNKKFGSHYIGHGFCLSTGTGKHCALVKGRIGVPEYLSGTNFGKEGFVG